MGWRLWICEDCPESGYERTGLGAAKEAAEMHAAEHPGHAASVQPGVYED